MNRNTDNQEFLTVHQVADRYGVSAPTIWRWLANSLIPEPHRFTASCSRWSLTSLVEFEATLEQERVPRAAWNAQHKRNRQRRRRRTR